GVSRLLRYEQTLAQSQLQTPERRARTKWLTAKRTLLPLNHQLSTINHQLLRSRFIRWLNLDFLSRAHEQVILETQPEILCFTAFLENGSGTPSCHELFPVAHHQP